VEVLSQHYVSLKEKHWTFLKLGGLYYIFEGVYQIDPLAKFVDLHTNRIKKLDTKVELDLNR
jgi:hypothetical protein